MHIFDSPFPILVGLNKDKNYVVDNYLDEKHPNCAFVLLDEDEIEIINYDNIRYIQEGNNINSYKILLNLVKQLFLDLLDKKYNEDISNLNNINNNYSYNKNSNVSMGIGGV